MQDCIFCEIIEGEVSNQKALFQNDQFIVIPSKYPAAEIHYLFIPKEHIQSVSHAADTNPEILKEILVLARKFAKDEDIKDFKLVFNNGRFQQIPHLHLHLLSGEMHTEVPT